MEKEELARDSALDAYTVTETYSVFRNGKKEPSAVRRINVTFTRDQGRKSKDVLKTGSGILQKFLLDPLLQKEEELSRDRQGMLITTENYAMEKERDDSIDGNHCWVLRLSPKRKSPSLLQGYVWVDSQNYHILRIEGKTSARPSIWTGHPQIRRDFRNSTDLGDFSLATHTEAVSNDLFFGKTILRIDYENYHTIQPLPRP